MAQERILIVGATGYIGKYLTKASVRLGYPTFALVRRSAGHDPAKVELLDSFKQVGVTFLYGSLEDHDSLVAALKQVDVVVSAVGGAQLKDQLKLLKAIKEVGHIKRFLPSEFASNPRTTHILPATAFIFPPKVEVQDAILAEKVPYTFVVSNTYAGFFAGNLGQAGVSTPPKEIRKANIYGHGRAYFVDEDDIATYTIKAAVDPRAENKELYIAPAKNLYSHLGLVELWEKVSGLKVEKIQQEEAEVKKAIDEAPFPYNMLLSLTYSITVKGDQDIEVPADAVEATQLYPDVAYTTLEQYFQRFL